MIRDLCVSIVSIWAFTHAIDFYREFDLKKDLSNSKISWGTEDVRPVKRGDNCNKKENNYYEKSNGVDDAIFIKGLGSVRSGAMEEASETIRDFYNINTSILTVERAQNWMFKNDSLDGDILINKMSNNTTKTLYLTDYPMTNNNGDDLLGYTFNNGKVLFVNTRRDVRHVTIHELGHTYGLDHCSDEDCYMYPQYNGYSKYMCGMCKSKISNKFPNLK
jgi:predicted Zn-dependent protease